MTLIATNEDGISSSFSFSVTVQTSSGSQGVQINNRISNLEVPAGAVDFTLPPDLFIETGFNITLAARNGDGTPLISALSFNPTTARFTGDLGVGQYPIRVIGIDGVGGSNIQTFTLSVTDVPPQITTNVNNLVAFVGSLFILALVIRDQYNLPVRSLCDINAAWLTYDNLTQTLSGTPGHGDVTTDEITCHFRNNRDFERSVTFPLTVQGQTEAQYGASIFGYVLTGFAVIGLVLGARYQQKIRDYLIGKAAKGVTGQLQRAMTLLALDPTGGVELADISEPPKAYATVYPVRLGEDFKTSVVIANQPELAGASHIIVKGVKRVENGQETNALPSWIKYRHDKGNGVINFFSLKTTDQQLGPHVVVVAGAHVGDEGVVEKEHTFIIDVSNAVNEDISPNQKYEKSINIPQIFPDYEEGDNLTVKVSRRDKSNHLIQLHNPWLQHTINFEQRRVEFFGMPGENLQGLYQVTVFHSRDSYDIKRFRFDITVSDGQGSSSSSS
jgi:hypothetical protein